LVLASASRARAQVLEAAGLPCIQDPSSLDEGVIKAGLLARRARTEEVAEALARAKAEAVSPRHSGALVIGADQMLECAGTWFDKPPDTKAAARQLGSLSGRTHRLVSAVCVVRDGDRLWHVVETARLTMRPLSQAAIAAYLEKAGPEALDSVGAYRLEGLGAQLFSEIDGDFFAILGLPLLPLLAFLRQHGTGAF